MTVSLLARGDGKPGLVGAARRLAGRVERGELQPADITEQVVQSHCVSFSTVFLQAVGDSLTAVAGLGEPQLLVRLGRQQHNADFLPWHIRLTEIQQLQSHWGVSPGQLLAVLQRYSGCHQRWGK